MLGLHVADAAGDGRIAQFQLFKNDVLFRMMVVLGVVLEILDDRPQNLVIRRLAAVENFQFLLQNKEQLFDVAVLFEQNFDNF